MNLVSSERFQCLQFQMTKMCSLVTTGLADVDGFKWCIQFAVSRASSPEHKKLSEL